MKYIRWFDSLTLQDIPIVGGKNASLGEMIRELFMQGIRVPTGFAVTAEAYWIHIKENNLFEPLKQLMQPIKKNDFTHLKQNAKKARFLIEHAELPDTVQKEVEDAYRLLCKQLKQKECSVAVRSSATAEDLPNASFAGQQETFLNVVGLEALIKAYKRCLASLFTERAIVYRIEKGFDHFSVALSAGIQQMVRSDKACSGVMFTIDTESGFKDAIVITSSYGLGETVVKGEVIPDEFHVFKSTLQKGYDPIIKAVVGTKKIKRIFGSKKHSVVLKTVLPAEQKEFSLTDDEVRELSLYGMLIEEHYSKINGRFCPMDIEWAKDGNDGKLYIVQARPETVHSTITNDIFYVTYQVEKSKSAKLLVTGQSIGQQAVSGKACVISSARDIAKVQEGDVVVTKMTDPDWVPIMKKASAIITDSGGRTCHAAIVSRELGIPAIVGTRVGTLHIKNGTFITIDCSEGSEGKVYEGKLKVETKKILLKDLKKPSADILLNIAAPERAYSLSQLPVDGVGLARLEFIITNEIQAHPMAFIEPNKVTDSRIRKKIKALTEQYKTPQDFFIDKVARAIGVIAAAFYPRPVLVRFSDFKSNEYRNLLGGQFFEPEEENPMMGLRGASRYYSALYAPAFELECKALAYVRTEMGLDNINVMVPFVRTLEEGKKSKELIKKYGLLRGKKKPLVYMMCEIPSNVLLIDKFASIFDAFSIGSNDLTQTTLSVDRDSGLLTKIFDERDPAVMIMLEQAIKGAHKAGKKIGICGQAPSDYPEIAAFLLKCGIDSLSLNADTVLPFLSHFTKKKEKNNE